MAKIIAWNVQRKINTETQAFKAIVDMLFNHLNADYLLLQEVTSASGPALKTIVEGCVSQSSFMGFGQMGNVTNVAVAKANDNKHYTRWDMGSQVADVERKRINQFQIKTQGHLISSAIVFDAHVKSGGAHDTHSDLNKYFIHLHNYMATSTNEAILIGDMNIECPTHSSNGIEMIGQRKTTDHRRGLLWTCIHPGVPYTHKQGNSERVLDFAWTTNSSVEFIRADTQVNQHFHNEWNRQNLWDFFDHQPIAYLVCNQYQNLFQPFVQGESFVSQSSTNFLPDIMSLIRS